ncbi:MULTISPECIES: hypothetical protein [unclassified Granulicatella]|jgi:hypothetical protein|uniref:hypothetical protein n=1 Tax=unclassified Granulicatella TaxID=2630493 RepID=UPI00066AB237|nr:MULTISPECIES: hypothetical protein [unclassified Granulicatella]DAJ16780.1 MAG TPA: hypothetical protein [Siphoviridae sp. cte3s7]DAX22790.1 MAG TPA: hypothetical protein [Caudoviricetes sp.]
MSKATKKEKEFVILLLELIKQYKDLDFDIIASLQTISKMVELFGLDDLNLKLMSESFKFYLEMEDE